MNYGKDFRNYYTKHLNNSTTILDSYTTSVLEKNFDSVPVDIYSKFLNDRIIWLGTDIDADVANIIKSQLLYLDSISDEDIKILIDSPGGAVYTSLGIIDIMDIIKCDVQTTNVGLAASMAAVILASGTKGKRKALKRSRTMIHQPLGYSGFSQASDMEIDVKQIKELKKELYEILGDKTGQSFDKIESDGDRDYWMTAQEAKKYGMIDEIVNKR